MPTSELSDALNPHVAQTRQRALANSYAAHLQPVVQPPQVFIPHRSELELAISEPPPPPPPPQPPLPPTRARTQPGVQAVHELLRVLTASKEAQDAERKRRLEWEQQQEEKHAQRQAELEQQLLEMRQELASVCGSMATNPTFMHAIHGDLSMPSDQPQQFMYSPPVFQPSYHHDPSFVQGLPSHSPQPIIQHSFDSTCSHRQSLDYTTTMDIEPLSPADSPFSLPTADEAASSRPVHTEAIIPSTPRNDVDDDNDSSSNDEQPGKRKNHHDTRCLSIHHAMRLHILRLMQIDSDRKLPDGHVEGTTTGPNDPVRFEWHLTPKQSAHNNRMKSKIIADLKSNRRLYKHVPDKNFNKRTLDSVFDQSFLTLRQKFKTQRDEPAASKQKKRVDSKALKARRLGRKKTKLSNRADSRMRLKIFEHSIFDSALQIDCMSSEESDSDLDILRLRGLPWRSSRLENFYNVLDSDGKDTAQKLKRGAKKERQRGPHKEGFFLPPKGIASWMISKRWISASRIAHPDLPDVLKRTVADTPEVDLKRFESQLGMESCDEAHV